MFKTKSGGENGHRPFLEHLRTGVLFLIRERPAVDTVTAVTPKGRFPRERENRVKENGSHFQSR